MQLDARARVPSTRRPWHAEGTPEVIILQNARTWALSAATCVMTLAPGAPASAQDLSPDAGLAEASAPLVAPIPWRLAADQEGLEAAVDHAAGLGFQDGFQFGLGVREMQEGQWLEDAMLVGASGRVGPFAFGLGWVTPRHGEPGWGRADRSLALRLGRQLSLGVRSELYESWIDTDGATRRLERTAVSSTWRPSRSMSLAFGVEDVDEAEVNGGRFEPYMTSSLSLRPGSERVSLGAQGGLPLRGEAPWRVGGAVRFMVTPGLELGGYGRYITEAVEPERIEWGAFLALSQRKVSAETSLDRLDPSGAPESSATSVTSLVRWTSSTRPEFMSPPGRVFVVNVEGSAPERPASGWFRTDAEGWAQSLMRLNSLAGDPSMLGVHIELHGAPGWAQSWELRRTLARLKSAGKHISVRLAWADMRALYLASVAHKVYGQPAGGVEAGGLAVTRTYLADLLQRMGIQAQFVAIGEHKTAPDALTRSAASDADKEQTRELLGDFESEWLSAVSAGRGLSKETLRASFAVSMKSMAAAHQAGLIDRVVGDNDLKAELREATGAEVSFVHSYSKAPETWPAWGGLDKVVVLPVLGTISAGGSSGGILASEDTFDRPMIKLLHALRKDRDVTAVVLRIDSPGGGVVASDRVYEAVRRLAAEKPVVVSMGSVAASGGYYVACGAKKIYATPLTVTGSIGIFAGKVHGAGLLERTGVGTHTERTGEHADQRSLFRPFNEAELGSLRSALEDSYERFVGIVGRARGMTVDEVKERAGGRIYSGTLARKRSLVDAEGSLWDAIQAASAMSGHDRGARVVYASPERSSGDALAHVSAPFGKDRLPDWLGSVGSWWTTIESLRAQPVQARLPFVVHVR